MQRSPGYAAVRAAAPERVALHTLSGATMGTRWTVKYDGSAAPEAVVGLAIEAALATVVQQMSTWEPDSDISRYNRAPAGTWVALPPGFAAVAGCALGWVRLSGGAFDPTVGPLVDVWGFGPRPEPECGYAGAVPPDISAVQAAQARTGWRRLQLEVAPPRLLQPGGLHLDFSGIAKGFAVDLVGEALSACGVADWLVEIGGELRARGRRPDGGAWRVGVEQPGNAAPLPLVLGDRAIATSGDRWHAFEFGGQRYAHTIDPRTGAPVAHDLASVTVVHVTCMDADALATALLVLGPEAGPAFARQHGIAAWFVRRGQGGGAGASGHATPAFEALLP